MQKDDFLSVFTSGFHKLNLVKVCKYGTGKTSYGSDCDLMLGLFEFVPPECVWDDDSPIDYGELKSLADEFGRQLSNCLVHKFKRTVTEDGDESKVNTVSYVFDIVPRNTVVFRFYRESRLMRMVVKGYRIVK